MRVYVMQVSAGSEQKVLQLLEKELPCNVKAVNPQKELFTRIKGVKIKSRGAILKGFLFFLEQEEGVMANISHILPSGASRLSPGEEETLFPILTECPTAGVSRVSFNSDGTMTVHEGPAALLKNNIVSVDKQRNRIRVQVELLNQAHTTELAYICK